MPPPIRALAIVVLNSYITIFSTTKNQNVLCNSGTDAIFLAPQLQCTVTFGYALYCAL